MCRGPDACSCDRNGDEHSSYTQEPAGRLVSLPEELAVGADYGLTVMGNASPGAYKFAMFILSAGGQPALARYGFGTPTLTSTKE